MTGKRSFVLCADDFGLSETIDRGILELVALGRLGATGCMVTGPAFEADAAKLAAVADRIDVGLHFALTDLPPVQPVRSIDPEGRPVSLGRVLGRSLLLRLDYEEMTAEIGRQVARFRAAFGRDPDFFDGHQHVQIFPGVRRAVFAAYDRGILDPTKTWLRDSGERPGRIVARGIETGKALFITALASGFARAARARGITVNEGFGGITAFEPERFPEVFPTFLDHLGPRPLVMCHPAHPEGPANVSDPIDRARRAEFAFLSSDTYAAALVAAGVDVVRMRALD